MEKEKQKVEMEKQEVGWMDGWMTSDICIYIGSHIGFLRCLITGDYYAGGCGLERKGGHIALCAINNQ